MLLTFTLFYPVNRELVTQHLHRFPYKFVIDFSTSYYTEELAVVTCPVVLQEEGAILLENSKHTCIATDREYVEDVERKRVK